MNNKIILLIIVVVALLIIFSPKKGKFGREPKQPKQTSVLMAQSKTGKIGEANRVLVPASAADIKLTAKSDNMEKKRIQESQEFVVQQIIRFNSWGKIDEAKIAQFRGVLLEYGDKIIQNMQKELASVSSFKEIDIKKSEELISNIDALQYFASNNFRNSRDVVKELAFRTPIDESGKIDKAKNQITFEAFDVLSSIDPELAMSYIHEITDIFKEAYIYHYILGRKMAGVPVKESLLEIEENFDKKFIPKNST